MPALRPRLLVLSGALSAATPTAQLAALAVKRYALRDLPVVHVALADHPLLLLDPEAEAPSLAGAAALVRFLGAADGVLLVAPDQAGGLAAPVRNALAAIDGAGGSFSEKAIAFAGGAAAVADLGRWAAASGLSPAGDALALAAPPAFAEDGELADPEAGRRYAALLDALAEAAATLAPDRGFSVTVAGE